MRTFSTFSKSLEALADWLGEERVTEVVMEATGQYWKPVWYVLEDRGFTLMLVNARHVKIFPGRKTDVGDAAWLAELLEHGLLRSSLSLPLRSANCAISPAIASGSPRRKPPSASGFQKTLEDAGIKLDSVASDILGVSGRALLRALCSGQRDPEALAGLAVGRLKKKIPQLRKALWPSPDSTRKWTG